jgi:toxin FitB
MGPDLDARMAATAEQHALILVTRNQSEFAGAGISLCNPWRA